MAKLEDQFGDVVGKARRGLKLSEAELAKKTGLTEQQINDIQDYKLKPDDAVIKKLAAALNLHADRLVASAHETYSPKAVDLGRWGCIAQFPSPYSDMIVHTYLIWDKNSKEAVLFDSGTQAGPIENAIQQNGLKLAMLCLTHTHADHVVVLPEIRKKYNPPVMASKNEPVDGAKFVKEGETLKCAGLSLKVFETDGHSPGGLTFVVSGFGGGLPDVAVVGDAIFAGSMGGPMVSYERLRSNVKNKILTLKDDTVLLPGHGPLTTVGEEKKNNPFFP